MMLALISLLLLFVFYQDYKFRGVSWFLFPILALLVAYNAATGRAWLAYFYEVALNLSILSIQLVLFYFVAIFRANKRLNLLKLIGLGDVLFFIIIALGLKSSLFPFFFTLSLAISLLLAFIFFKGKTIPLAGLQALTLMIWLFLSSDFVLYD